LGNAINLVLDPCFIFGLGPFPELGVTGAAVSTNIGRGTAVLYQLMLLARGEGRVRIALRHLRFDLTVMRSVIRLSGSGTLQILIGTASYVGIVRIISLFGSSALAGYTIGIRVIVFALLPAFGISNAAATMVGQNLGAGRPDRAERAVWTAARYNMICLGAVGLVFLLLAGPIAGLFTRDAEVLGHAVNCLRIVCLGFVFYGAGMGADAGVQWRRQHVDPDGHQSGRLLGVGDPAGVVALVTRRLGPDRSLRRDGHWLFVPRGGERDSVQKGDLEDGESLTRAGRCGLTSG